MIHQEKRLSIKLKCELLSVNRSSLYYVPCKSTDMHEEDAAIMNEMCDIYMQHPYFGYRRMQVMLARKGYAINHKKVQRLMKLANLKAIYPKKRTTIRNPQHQIYPYLLKKEDIQNPNEAWCVDITYIKIQSGFVYLVALIDVFSRKIMGWNVSTFLDTESCLIALDMALINDVPIMINSDQGCQFTSEAWTATLAKEGILISMDGKGRWVDNVLIERFWRSIKYELIYLQSIATVAEAKRKIEQFINFYNYERPHQSLNYRTPQEVFEGIKISKNLQMPIVSIKPNYLENNISF